MANWLAKIGASGVSGIVSLANMGSSERSRIIGEGADIILRYRRNPMMHGFDYTGPIEGVAIIRDQQAWELYLASVIAASVRDTKWMRHQFYYACQDIPRIRETRPWRDLWSSVAKSELEPLLVCEKDVHVFEGRDWMLCEVKLCLA
jgi:hypothetical protein